MATPALALGWELWRPRRWGLTLVALYMVGLNIAFQVVPPSWRTEGVAAATLIPMICVANYLALLSCYGSNSDIFSRDSCFPARMFTLPVPTSQLVAWPILVGVLTCILLWLNIAYFVLRPCGIKAPVVWPALLPAAVLAWMQAMIWWPCGIPLLRLALVIVSLSVIPFTAGVALAFGMPESLVSTCLAGTVFLGWIVAYGGVARARRGENPDWHVLLRHLGRLLPRRTRPFASAEQARVWLEWRQSGVSLVMVFATWLVFILPGTPCFENFLEDAALSGVMPEVAALSPETRRLIMALYPFLLPWFVAFIVGAGLGNRTLGRGPWALSSFEASQPLTTVDMVRAKVWMTARATAGLWAVLLAALPPWLLLTGYHEQLTTLIQRVLHGYSPLQGGLVVVLVFVGLVLLTWRELVVNLFVPLTGRTWIVHTVSAVYLGLFLSSYALARWFYFHPEWFERLRMSLPWILVLLVPVKFLAASWGLTALHRRQLLSPCAILTLLGLWVLSALGIMALLAWLLPVSVLYVVLGVVLVLPLARPSFAPLALAWNRHR